MATNDSTVVAIGGSTERASRRREFAPAIRKVLRAHQDRVHEARAIARLISRGLYSFAPGGVADLDELNDLQRATDAIERLLKDVQGIADLADIESQAEVARG